MSKQKFESFKVNVSLFQMSWKAVTNFSGSVGFFSVFCLAVFSLKFIQLQRVWTVMLCSGAVW